jgi:hypothetical protein
MRYLQGTIVATQAAVVADIRPEIPEGSPVVPYLRLIFTNLPFRSVIAAIRYQAIFVLLKLPLITLQLTLICAEIDCAARLR